ncbi:MAG: hypothetical protein JXB04_08495 [Kiritimatiellae bacterium]|nr:hypothetical protein [Kiritimatiellia bacterium]
MNADDYIREYNERLNRLKAELSCPRLDGPHIVRADEPRELAPKLRFTGLHFYLSNRRLTMQAPILREDSWLFSPPLTDLYLYPPHVPFSFTVPGVNAPLIDDEPLVDLPHIIKQLYALAPSPAPLPQFLCELDDLIGPTQQSSPLHTDCLDFTNPDLAKHGFAIARIVAKGTMLRVRFAWVFPKDREARPVVHYMPAGTLRLRTDRGDVLGNAEWLPATAEGITSTLQQWLVNWAGQNPARLFSEAGRFRVEDKLFWEHGVKSPRRAAHEKRVAFVREHPELWDDEEALTQALRDAGLYSPKTGRRSIQYACHTLIEEARKQSLPPPDGGDQEACHE